MRFVRTAFACGVLACAAFAQTVYHSTPDWISSDQHYSTGAALVDLDRDGWVDLVVSNGNDMGRQRVAVYYNQGNGTFPLTPDWQSSGQAYNGHLDVADVNGDGWPDVAVAVLGNGTVFGPAAKLFLNNAGTLSSTPDWTAPEVVPAFGCAFGDVNNDGRPDLAVATGWSYGTSHLYHNYVYLNIDGALDSSASWQSDDTWDYQGVLWVDANDDGWLDLVGVGTDVETQIYTNLGGVLETTASWHTSDSSSQDAIMAVAGDVTGDGWRELFVTDNTQLGGSGRFRQYTGLAAGYYQTTYGWSYAEGYGSALALADVNDDGLLDLATGGWWDYSRLFFNTGSGLSTAPDWSSTVSSVIEKIVFADIDNDGVQTASETLPANGGRLFYLSRRPIGEISRVRVDGVELGPDQYTADCVQGWITAGTTPAATLEVTYTYSLRLDMAITNWDNNVGNYIYYNQLGCIGDLDGDGATGLADLAELLGHYGCVGECPADLNHDGATNLADLALLLAHYGCQPG